MRFTWATARHALGCSLALGTCLSIAPASARTTAAFATPDSNRTRAYFIKMVYADGSFAIPQLNGLSGTITYYNGRPTGSLHAKVYTAWGTFGNPPPPSNGGTIVAYLVLRTWYALPFFGQTLAKSSIAYAGLNPAKTYSIDVWDVTKAPIEYKLWSIGSPTNGTLTFESPLDSYSGQDNSDVVALELVQNP